MTQQAKTQKQVQIIARYTLKNNPGVVLYRVRSSNGKDEYCTRLFHGKAQCCSCPSKKPCYHMTQLEEREQSRFEARIQQGIRESFFDAEWMLPPTVTPDVEVPAERAAYLASTQQTTSDTINHIEEENKPQPIHDGYYTVSDGGEHRTFRIRTQAQDADFAPGKQIIAFLSGSNNEADYTGFGFVSLNQLLTWKRFRYGYEAIQEAARFLLDGDHTEAGKMYAQESGNCYVCNRLLTTPESIAAGIGPVCASRVGVATATPLGGYDVVTEALQVVNAEIVSQRIGDAYEQRAEQMRKDAEATRRINFELSMGY